MNDRTKFIGAWVSKEEKEEIIKIAKAQNISISNLIRRSVIRPMMTLPDVAQSVKLHIDNKFRKLESEIKKQMFAHEPIRRTIIEEYGKPIKGLRPPSSPIISTPEQKRMADVISQLKKIIQGEEEYSFVEVPEEIITQKRPKTDQLAYIEFKNKKK